MNSTIRDISVTGGVNAPVLMIFPNTGSEIW